MIRGDPFQEEVDVEYVRALRKSPRVPVFTVTQGQYEIGRRQDKQLAARLPDGGSALSVEGPSLSSVAAQRREGVAKSKPNEVQLTTLRSKWSADAAEQIVASWLRLATSRAEKFSVVAGQPHELARGGAKALQNVEDPPQKNLWTAMPFLGIGIAGQVQPLVDRRVLAAAVVTSVTMELAILLARAIETQAQPAACSIVETSCYPELEKLRPLP